MKRRSFLTMIGGAAAAPLLPAMPAAAVVAPVNQYTYGLAALHARIEPGLPVNEMARRFRLSSSQAEALADRLVSDGLVNRHGGLVKAKRMFVQQRGFGRPVERARKRRSQGRETAGRQDVSPLMAHLHCLCKSYGMPLSPRALTMETIA